MTDTTMPVRDGGLVTRNRRILDEPAGVTPVNAEHPDQLAAKLAAMAPLAGVVGLSASGKAAVAQAFTFGQSGATGPSSAFTPIAGRPFNVTISGGQGVQAQLERSFDAGATWYAKISDALRLGLPESFSDIEHEVGVRYRVNILAITGGTVTVRLSQ